MRDVAQRPGAHLLLGAQPFAAEALRIAHDGVELGVLNGLEHARGLGEIGGERLLDQHRHAALHRRQDGIDMQMLVGRDQGGGDLRPAHELAVIGGDEIGPDPARHVGAAVGILLGDTDPFDRGVARRHLAAEQPDPARPHDREPDSLDRLLHPRLRLRRARSRLG